MFSDRLWALRTGQHLTLKQLARELNRKFSDRHRNTSPQIENWERGTRIPSYRELMKLAQFFHVSMDYLAGKSGQDQIDLAKLLGTNKQLQFGCYHLNSADRNEIFALIQGYFHGKTNRIKAADSKRSRNQQQTFNLNFRNQD